MEKQQLSLEFFKNSIEELSSYYPSVEGGKMMFTELVKLLSMLNNTATFIESSRPDLSLWYSRKGIMFKCLSDIIKISDLWYTPHYWNIDLIKWDDARCETNRFNSAIDLFIESIGKEWDIEFSDVIDTL